MADRTSLPHEVVFPSDLTCPLCEAQHEYLPTLLDHLTTHFEFAPSMLYLRSRAMALVQPSWALAFSQHGDDDGQRMNKGSGSKRDFEKAVD